jgi:hypothetical protein
MAAGLLPSEAPPRAEAAAGSADQNGSRGPNNLALGAGILYGTVQALLPMGFAAPSPAPHLRDFEAGRGGAMAVTGLAMFFQGLALANGGAGLDILGLAGAPFTGGASAVALAPGTAAAGAAIATHGVANMWAGFNILLMSRDLEDKGGGSELKWGNPESRPTYGHTFTKHGQGKKNTRNLMGRAAGERTPQGQWLDDQAAARLLSEARPHLDGPAIIRLPQGLGQVILPDGRILPARHALVVPAPNGGIRTAYPVLGSNW